MGTQNQASDKMLADYAVQKSKYEKQQKEISEEARRAGDEAERDERRALHYDLGEGFLEIALVLSSLFFISRKKMFPVMGGLSGIAGVAIAVTALMI